ncbi:tyrosine-type recombinase/integrase [Paraburkholderia sp. BL10I2N1]|uniref:site-specific integrase n=1 Tax=Paraburkholderia sp. BL10I2N1 TaxID=1938796 RepID=UPI00105B3551|nr:tyrosine-type recombinase/integrase [Paraburkholderia sp. BL10I2N1]TDN68782.1 phage integrase family protein with SAM-like domain [Paraburkholderia sp. BL10I2N1]
MSDATSDALHSDPAALSRENRNALVVTYVRLEDDSSVPLSYYGEPVWNYSPYVPHAARARAERAINWDKTPTEWVESAKSAIWAFTHRKPLGGIQLDPATIPKRALTLNAFAKWCSSAGIKRFRDVRAFDIARYLQKLRDKGVYDRTLAGHIAVLRKVYDMRSYLTDSFTDEAIAALRFDQVGPLWEPDADEQRRTELIPLGDAVRLFSAARAHLEDAERLLRIRDKLEFEWQTVKERVDRKTWGNTVKRPAVLKAGFKSAYEFESALVDIRTAAYIVIALSTGCRVHELGDARVGCVYSELVDGETYWWLKSATRKIGDGPARWLAPEIAKEAVSVLERHSAPLRKRVMDELDMARKQVSQPMSDKQRAHLAVRILELERNSERLFLSDTAGVIVSTETKAHNKQLRAFASRKGIQLDSALHTHRFRRTYAVIVVHLNKGPRIDLVTLQHHFKHASVVMTEWYAALSETDRELFELIEEETDLFDLALVDHWMVPSTPLAGGLGKRIKAYPGRHHQPMFFKSRREFVDSIRDGLNIRSTGHSWCLAEAEDCGGRGLFEAFTCDGCGNGVIDDSFAEVWQNLRAHHVELVGLEDIGPGGRAKAKRGLAAADAVLAQLATGTEEDSDA